MRTTIEITDELLRQAKEKAAAGGTALRQVVEVRSTKNFRL
jgi:Arc/MetJ family transcription regulator